MIASSRLLTTAAVCLAAAAAARADVRLPAIFGDHMVLQQDMGVPLWGWADPGEGVEVTIAGHSARATAGPDGKWQVKLPKMASSSEPATVTIAGKNTITLHDVLIGETWVCSGQSNMEFSLAGAHNAATELPAANDPGMRLFHVDHATAHTPAADVKGTWSLCTPDSAKTFTAVGYFFGKELRAKYHRPVGLIESNWGGTPAEAWTSVEGLKMDGTLARYVEQWNKTDANFASASAAYPAAMAAYKVARDEWMEKYGKAWNAANDKWRDAAAAAVLAKQPLPPKPAPGKPVPTQPLGPDGGAHGPAALYNGMIAPIQPYAIRGVIWYQGESNATRGEEYKTLFPRMIKDWRRTWAEGDFPFLWVQLASYGADNKGWPLLREAQAETLALPNTGMATAIDIGLPWNIHPMDKMDVGKRLALAAFHVAYGETLVYAGPTCAGAVKDPAGVKVTYKDAGSGLEIGKSPWMEPKVPVFATDHLAGFELSGTDGNWTPADAKIDGDTVIVSGTAVPSPTGVRYDWAGSPEGNLYNKEGLPAFPFRARVR